MQKEVGLRRLKQKHPLSQNESEVLNEPFIQGCWFIGLMKVRQNRLLALSLSFSLSFCLSLCATKANLCAKHVRRNRMCALFCSP